MELECRHFSTIDSTNSFAKEHLASFDPSKLQVISADHQTAGRGQFNRRWLSEEGKNIIVTFAFFMEQGRSDIVHIPQVLALSVIKVLEKNNFHPQMKWPNDLMIDSKKIGGILCETTTLNHQLGVVLGLGLNVNMNAEWFEKIDQPATSLSLVQGAPVDRDHLFKNLLDCFKIDLLNYLKNGFPLK